MKKFRALLVLLMGTFVILTGAKLELHANTETKLIIHYYRFDEDYSGWNLWLWPYEPTSGSGNGYNFNGDSEYGKTYEVVLADSPFAGSTSIGVIVRLNNWEAKDISADRHIDITQVDSNNEVNVYLISGDPNIYYDAADVDKSHRALNISFTSADTVGFNTTKMIDEDQVTLLEGTTPLTIDSFTYNEGRVDIAFDGEVDLSKVYTLVVDFEEEGVDPKEYQIGFDGIYGSNEFNAVYAYDGELGAIYSSTSTTFKLWAPISESIELNLYHYGHTASQTDYDGNAGTDVPYATHDLTYTSKGVWEVTVSGDLHGVYYTYNVTNNGITNEVSDPYAFSTGINGLRSMVVDFERLNPEGWDDTEIPDTIESYNDSIIYELHVRDFTTHESWNGTEDYRGKFLGLTETGTTYMGVTTGLDHIIELGVTHVQLLPVFDYGAAVDETKLLDSDYSGVKDTVFNWGYMPENFNSVEGSYSTNPYDGSVRVTEFKQLIQTFHENGIRVVMDVVYNHTGRSADSNFDLIVPGYYFRMNDNGSFSNGSGTGNETASENYMMSKFIVDSVTFWAEEYNVTGFRFDLMKLHDVDTMNAVVDSVHAIDPTILVYGEPWTGGTSLLPEEDAAYNANLDQMPGVAVFNDDTRDGIKGSVFNETDTGFIQATSSSAELDARIMLGVAGGVAQMQIPVASLPKGAWAVNPNQTVNYATAHDNNVLYDKLMLSTDSETTYEQIQDMQKQANAIILTSNGIPFLHAGVDIMRSKPCTVIDGEAQGECDASLSYDHNSYRSPDQTNQIDWSWKVNNLDVFNYYKGMISIRRNIGVFSYDSLEALNEHYYFFPDGSGVVSYIIYDAESPWEYTYVIHNSGVTQRNMSLQGMEWNLVANKEEAGLETIEVLSGDVVTVQPNETLVMYQLKEGAVWPTIQVDDPVDDTPTEKTGCFGSIGDTSLFIGALSVVGVAALVLIRKKH